MKAGDVLATIEAKRYQLELEKAQLELQNAEEQMRAFGGPLPAVKAAQLKLEEAQLELSYAQVRAPITGVAGFRMIDTGNYVHADESIVMITQLQPISVIIRIPANSLSQVRAQIAEGKAPVEAMGGPKTVLATGRAVAIDNLIDQTTGTAGVKAEFDNKNGAFLPGQTVTVHFRLR